MRTARRLDLPTGEVPDYRTFVRHLWSYDDPNGTALAPPPVMYRILFEQHDPDWSTIRATAETAVVALDLQERITWVRVDEGQPVWELRFADLTALHIFCVLLGSRARSEENDAAIRVGEFIMWTLGFRWV